MIFNGAQLMVMYILTILLIWSVIKSILSLIQDAIIAKTYRKAMEKEDSRNWLEGLANFNAHMKGKEDCSK